MNIQPLASTINRDTVVASIRRAADRHQIDFDYLLQQAKVESGLDPSARARTSSATGLYQFTTGTWMAMVKRHGDSVGLGGEAQLLRGGGATAEDRARILALRSDPDVSAQLAARFALDNAKQLSAAGHKNIGPTELYLAHFLGASGASAFLDGLKATPANAAAKALPLAAQSNASIFFGDGGPRSFKDIYARFANKFASAAPQPVDAGARETAVAPQRLSDIVAQVLAPPAASTLAPTPAEPPAVSADVLSNFLRRFDLVDPKTDILPRQSDDMRDATQRASADAPATRGDELAPFGLGARLILKASQAR